MPKTIIGMLISILLIPFIYILILAFTHALELRDLLLINKSGVRFGLFSKPILRFTKFLERFVTE
jgi:stage V sporulation protein B